MARAGLSIRERMGAIERRARRFPPVRSLMSINDAYNAAGGGLLASGLAFSALFAVIPGLLLVISVLVLVAVDEATKRQVIEWLIDRVPPLEGVATQIVTNLADGARVGTLLGFLAFLWGATGLYLALENALGRFFPSRRGRDPIMGRIRSIVAVLLVVGGVLVAFGLSIGLSVIAATIGRLGDGVVSLLSPIISVGAASLICLACYVLVPVEPPRVRAAAPASLLAGVFIGILTALFGFIAPWLVSGFQGLGAIASVFIALVWFGYVFQALLYGAAYARMLDDRDRSRRAPPTV